jgi:hypothetical protein
MLSFISDDPTVITKVKYYKPFLVWAGDFKHASIGFPSELPLPAEFTKIIPAETAPKIKY